MLEYRWWGEKKINWCGQCIQLAQETIRKLTHYQVQNDVESDARQETKATFGHTSMHAQHKLYAVLQV